MRGEVVEQRAGDLRDTWPQAFDAAGGERLRDQPPQPLVVGDGRPHVTPLVAVWLGGALYFCTGDTEQKAVNLAANPHVILTTGCNRWDGGLDVVLEGDAVQVTDDDLLRRLAEAWTAKWDGRWQFQVRDGCFQHMEGLRVPVFAVRPVKVLAFAKGEVFSHTSHRF